ncbi:MAG: hypothetical protein KKH51_08980 [Actinobacteria bacterium]|nr:hypothetical protein [Actinomycetota bacterium]
MNATLTTAPGRQDHPPQQTLSHPVRRVGTLDRLALHLGVALIKWGRRPSATPTRERRANRFEQNLLRLERERDYERRYRLDVQSVR